GAGCGTGRTQDTTQRDWRLSSGRKAAEHYLRAPALVGEATVTRAPLAVYAKSLWKPPSGDVTLLPGRKRRRIIGRVLQCFKERRGRQHAPAGASSRHVVVGCNPRTSALGSGRGKV